MNASEIIRTLAKRFNIKHKDIAKAIGVTNSNFSEKLKSNAVKGQELLDIIKYLGYEIVFIKNDKAFKIEPARKGIGEPCRMVVNGVECDTEKADAVCHTENNEMFLELYRDPVGEFFVALYPKWNAKPDIILISNEEAHDMYNRYGDGSCDYMFEKTEKISENSLKL